MLVGQNSISDHPGLSSQLTSLCSWGAPASLVKTTLLSCLVCRRAGAYTVGGLVTSIQVALSLREKLVSVAGRGTCHGPKSVLQCT